MALVLEAMATSGKPLAELARSIPKYHMTQTKVACPRAFAREILKRLVAEHEVGLAVRTLLESGVSAILNLTSVPLEVPERVVVQQADLPTQLLLLSYQARKAGGDGKTT